MNRNIQLRSFLLGLSGLVAATLASAQEFPTKQLRLLVPYPTASGPDLVARPAAAAMGKFLGQTVVVENKSGGGGVPAIQDLKNSPADGHTLFWPDSSQWAILPAVQAGLPYDPVRDFAPIGMVYSNVLFFFVPANSPIKSMKDIVARAKANPGSLRYGVTGVGGIMHLTGEAFAAATKIKMTVVPYRATNESITAIMGGDLDLAIAGGNPVYQSMLQAGKIRTVATTGPTRNTYMLDIPSVKESAGLKQEYNFQAEIGLMALAGTPKPVIEKLSSALHVAQKDAGFLDVIKKLQYDVVVNSPEEFAAQVRSDLEKYRAVAKAGNVKVQ